MMLSEWKSLSVANSAIALLLFLSGCATPQTPEQYKASVDADAKRLVDTYGSACEALGAARGSQSFTQCVMRYWDAERAQKAAKAQALGNALQQFGNTVYGPEATRARQMPIPPAPVTCQTSASGRTTTCY